MTTSNALLLEVQNVIMHLKSAEAALGSDGVEASKIDAASVGINGAMSGFSQVAKLLAEAQAKR
jgi:hypothetical protein